MAEHPDLENRRRLQHFTGFKLNSRTNVKPPADWATGAGTKPTEATHPLSHLTLYVKVRISRIDDQFLGGLVHNYVGRTLGVSGRIGDRGIYYTVLTELYYHKL